MAALLVLGVSGCATARCRDLRPGEVAVAPSAVGKVFGARVWSSYGATTGEVQPLLTSARGEKRLAEIAVLECAFAGWAAGERARAAR